MTKPVLSCHIYVSQVCRWIESGVHWQAGDEVYISWGRRLLHCPGLLFLDHQVLILRLLADYPEGQAVGLLAVLDKMGGVRQVFKRFYRHYDVSNLARLYLCLRENCFIIF